MERMQGYHEGITRAAGRHVASSFRGNFLFLPSLRLSVKLAIERVLAGPIFWKTTGYPGRSE